MYYDGTSTIWQVVLDSQSTYFISIDISKFNNYLGLGLDHYPWICKLASGSKLIEENEFGMTKPVASIPFIHISTHITQNKGKKEEGKYF